MGTYNLSKEEFKDKLKDFLQCVEGQVFAKVMADSWNELADENGWSDRLEAFEYED